MKRTEYNIPQMDCSSEEQMIKLKLEGIGEIQSLHFDLPARQLGVIHEGDADPVTAALEELNLGSARIQTTGSAAENTANQEDDQRKALWMVLVINASFFLIEMVAGFIAGSMGLLGDSLDMLADSIV